MRILEEASAMLRQVKIPEPAPWIKEYIVIAIIVIVAILFIRMLIKFSITRYYKYAAAVVKNTSKRLQALEELNRQYTFHEIPEYKVAPFSIRYKKSYDNFRFEKALVEHIKKNISIIEERIRKNDENVKTYPLYIKAFGKLPEGTSKSSKAEITEAKHIPFFLYKSIEDRIYTDKRQDPKTGWQLTLKAKYTSPAGKRNLQKEKTFFYHDLKSYTAVVREGINSTAYQRSLMTDSLRYDILKRDNFKCQICGRGAKMGVVLHVDHILPISKGGRTEPSNLRTLCECCNLGKSNKYDPNGLN